MHEVISDRKCDVRAHKISNSVVVHADEHGQWVCTKLAGGGGLKQWSGKEKKETNRNSLCKFTETVFSSQPVLPEN